MPYSITTKDGITLQNIPDDVPPDSQELKDRVMAIRAQAAETATEAAPEQPQMGVLESIGEAFTGARRTTPETATLPEWTSMPEMNELSLASFKSALGTMATRPEETVQILKSNFPGMQIRQDEKGNFILRSSIDQQEYAIPPGFSIGDIPRVAGTMLAFTPAGKVTSIPGAMIAGAATQAGIEASQAATGGEFGVGEVGLAGLIGGAVPAIGGAISAAREPVKRLLGIGVDAAHSVTGSAAPMAEVAAARASAEEVGTLAAKASGKGIGSATARQQLAEMAQVNPEAKAAAERLGLDLPFDVFSDNPQIRAAVGLTRSVAGGEAEAAWRNTVSTAVDKADDVIKQFDATFIEGQVAPGAVSQKIRESLTATRAQLNKDASVVYQQVDEVVPRESLVGLPKLRQVIDDIKREVGGDAGLSSQERKLDKLLSDGNVTYGRLIREKNLVGQAMAGKDSPYGNMEAGSLKRLYAALSEDQLSNVGTIGGEELRQQLRGANLLYAKERALGKRIINSFGEDIEGSVANKMRAAITSAARGDSGEFAKLMKVVPEDLRRETVATALASVTRSSRGAERGAFGFSEFAKTYQGLRANPPVYKQVVEALGPESDKMLRDLYEISRRITDARANVLTTGKANQAIVDAMKAEGLIDKILGSTIAKVTTTGAAAAGGGPVAAMGASALNSALGGGGKDAIREAGKLFMSDEFKKLAMDAATKSEVSKSAVRRLAMSKAFNEYMKAIRAPRTMTEKEQWILSALQTYQQMNREGE